MGQWVNGGYGIHMDSWDLIWLVVSHINFIFPFHIWDVILPIDVHIFQDGYCTTNQGILTIIKHGETIFSPLFPIDMWF